VVLLVEPHFSSSFCFSRPPAAPAHQGPGRVCTGRALPSGLEFTKHWFCRWWWSQSPGAVELDRGVCGCRLHATSFGEAAVPLTAAPRVVSTQEAALGLLKLHRGTCLPRAGFGTEGTESASVPMLAKRLLRQSAGMPNRVVRHQGCVGPSAGNP